MEVHIFARQMADGSDHEHIAKVKHREAATPQREEVCTREIVSKVSGIRRPWGQLSARRRRATQGTGVSGRCCRGARLRLLLFDRRQ